MRVVRVLQVRRECTFREAAHDSRAWEFVVDLDIDVDSARNGADGRVQAGRVAGDDIDFAGSVVCTRNVAHARAPHLHGIGQHLSHRPQRTVHHRTSPS